MAVFHLLIKTPDSQLLDIQAQSLFVRATDGDTTILADHEDTLMALDVCIAQVIDEKGEKSQVLLNGGVLQVKQNVVIVSAIEGELIGKKEKDIAGKTESIHTKNINILNEVKEALAQGGYFQPEIELSTLLAEERLAKYDLLKEIRE